MTEAWNDCETNPNFTIINLGATYTQGAAAQKGAQKSKTGHAREEWLGKSKSQAKSKVGHSKHSDSAGKSNAKEDRHSRHGKGQARTKTVKKSNRKFTRKARESTGRHAWKSKTCICLTTSDAHKENAESKPTSNRPGGLKGMQTGELTDRKEVHNAVICRTRQILFAGRGIGGVQAGRCKPK